MTQTLYRRNSVFMRFVSVLVALTFTLSIAGSGFAAPRTPANDPSGSPKAVEAPAKVPDPGTNAVPDPGPSAQDPPPSVEAPPTTTEPGTAGDKAGAEESGTAQGQVQKKAKSDSGKVGEGHSAAQASKKKALDPVAVTAGAGLVSA